MGTFDECQSPVEVQKLLDRLEAEGKATGFIRTEALLRNVQLDLDDVGGGGEDEDFPDMPSLVTHPMPSTSAQSAGECQQHRCSSLMRLYYFPLVYM